MPLDLLMHQQKVRDMKDLMLIQMEIIYQTIYNQVLCQVLLLELVLLLEHLLKSKILKSFKILEQLKVKFGMINRMLGK
jgi:putative ubiquitin-RnfH superfamily antitoxin RatB of RatAB toxin-antitoxin module